MAIDERTTQVHTVQLPADEALDLEVAGVGAGVAAGPADAVGGPTGAHGPRARPAHRTAAEAVALPSTPKQADVPDGGVRPSIASAESLRLRRRRQALLPVMRALRDALGEPARPLERPCRVVGSDGRCSERALDRSFEALVRQTMDDAEEPFRFSVWGDSLVAGDSFTGEVRERFQAQFGSGGHGYLHMGTPERTVGHRGVNVQRQGTWSTRTIVREPDPDRLLGLAGAAYEPADSPTLRVEAGRGGRPIDRVGVLLYRRASRASVRVDTPSGRRNVSLGGSLHTDHVEWIVFDPPVAWVRVSEFSESERYFGLLQDHRGPGVVVDNLGLVSGRERRLAHVDPAHWSTQVRLRGTQVLVFFYGVNSARDSAMGQAASERYQAEYRGVLDRVRAMEGPDCLVMGILTRGQRRDGGVGVRASVSGMNAAQREAAMQSGCAFWSAYETIGAEQGPARWLSASPPLLGSDLSHPTRAGYRELGRLFYQAWIAAFVDWLEEEG